MCSVKKLTAAILLVTMAGTVSAEQAAEAATAEVVAKPVVEMPDFEAMRKQSEERREALKAEMEARRAAHKAEMDKLNAEHETVVAVDSSIEEFRKQMDADRES